MARGKRRTASRIAVVLGALLSASACSLVVDTGGLAGPSRADADNEAGSPESSLADAAGDRAADAPTSAELYRASVISDRPIAYWTFDDPMGSTTARPLVGDRSATATGTVTFGADGVVGTALAVEDRKGALEVGDVFDLLGSAPFSFEVWLKPSVGNNEFYEFFNKRVSAGNGFLGYVAYVRKVADGTMVQWEQGTPTGLRGTTTSVALDRWQHVVFTFDGVEDMHVFVDGVRDRSSYADAPARGADNDAQLRIVPSYRGSIDEVAIYDHALSQDRIRAHAELGKR